MKKTCINCVYGPIRQSNGHSCGVCINHNNWRDKRVPAPAATLFPPATTQPTEYCGGGPGDEGRGNASSSKFTWESMYDDLGGVCGFKGTADRKAATPEPSKKRGKILLKALDIINGERQDTYGDPEDSFALIGEYWTSFLSRKGSLDITPRDVAEMMMLFKIARMSGQKQCLDNYSDLAGYAGLAADMVEEE